MAMASVMRGLAFRIGPGVCHFLSHKISTVLYLHHDLSNSILLPHIMELNLDEIQDKVVRIAFAMRLDSSPRKTQLKLSTNLTEKSGSRSNCPQEM